MNHKVVSIGVSILSLLVIISAGIVFAAQPIQQTAVADVSACGRTFHLEGTAFIQEGNVYHVHYVLSGVDENGQALHATPQVLVSNSTHGNSSEFVLHDHLDIVQQGSGVVSQHMADYNFHWENGQLVVDEVRVEDSCP